MDGHPSKILIIVLVVLIVLSMLFSISESSILGMNRLKLRMLRQKKDKRALRVSKLLENKDRLINTLLVSNDLVNIFISSLITSIALDLVGQKGVGIATLLATVLLLIFGEITPKSISVKYPDKIAYGLSGFISFVCKIMHPLVFIVTGIANGFLRLLGINPKKKQVSYTEEEIKTFFDLSSESGIIEEDENRMMSQVFKFSDFDAEDIMIPRTKIRAVSLENSFTDVLEMSERLGFTRFPVYKDSIDDIVGILYLKDMLKYKNNPEIFKIEEVMRPPLFINGSKKISSVQTMLFENRQSMAIIVDEYSGTDGIITEKDISKEIFALPGDDSLRGKIFDYDNVSDKNNFEINGAVLLRVLKDDLKIDLNSTINETIGGWITEQLNRMPEAGDSVEFQGWNFIVLKIQAHRIERVQIKKTDE